MITILSRRVVSNIWVATLKVKVTAWPCSKNVLFAVRFYNYLTERNINGKKQELMIIKELFEYCPQYYQMLV